MDKKYVAIALLVVAIVIGGEFFAYIYFTQKNDAKETSSLEKSEIPSKYENLDWGSTYEEVYDYARSRGEKITNENEFDGYKVIITTRNGYEDVKGTIRITYHIENTGGLKDVMVYFEKNKCTPDLNEIYNSYKERLNKYCTLFDKKYLFWTNNKGISYSLNKNNNRISFAISKYDPYKKE